MAKRITTEQLHAEIKVIKENHLAHIHDCIHRLESDVKDNRKFFTERLDRLDSRIYWILGTIIATLATVIGSMLV
jgi:hypothetical protein